MRHRRIAQPAYEPEYFADLNTTPLIDVLLVLLVMIMLSLPIAAHKVPIELPSTGTSASAPPVTHRLSIAQGGGLSWDGAAIPEAALPARLAVLAVDPAKPLLILQADAQTRYERVDATLATIKRAGVTAMSFEGIGKWGKW